MQLEPWGDHFIRKTEKEGKVPVIIDNSLMLICNKEMLVVEVHVDEGRANTVTRHAFCPLCGQHTYFYDGMGYCKKCDMVIDIENYKDLGNLSLRPKYEQRKAGK